jgi:hypothetical protein
MSQMDAWIWTGRDLVALYPLPYAMVVSLAYVTGADNGGRQRVVVFETRATERRQRDSKAEKRQRYVRQ